MNSMRYLILLFLTALVAAGCGGGGGGGSTSGSTRLATFITDSMDDNDHVWVTVHRIELLKVGGGSEVVFEDAVGRVIDLKTLRDVNGERFKLLSVDGIPSGPYLGARITLAKSLTVFGAGATTGTAMTFANQFDDGTGKSAFTLNFGSAKNFTPGNDELVIDFDLANWDESGNVVTPEFRESNGQNIHDRNRHEDEDYKGTISALSGTSPNFSFVLTQGLRTLNVKTTADTDIFENDGVGNPQLMNGKRVEVRGVFSTDQDALIATSIKIKDSDDDDDDEDEAKGPASAVDATAGTFVVTVHEAEGFVPTQTTVNVVVTGTTRFFADGGRIMTRDEFFAALGTSTEVEVEGVYDAGTNTLTAQKAKLEDESEDDEAEADGAPSGIDAAAGTFNVTLAEWSGFSGSLGQVLAVTTNTNTTYRNDNGDTITKEAFFTALATSPLVEVEGTYNGGTMIAKKVKLDDD